MAGGNDDGFNREVVNIGSDDELIEDVEEDGSTEGEEDSPILTLHRVSESFESSSGKQQETATVTSELVYGNNITNETSNIHQNTSSSEMDTTLIQSQTTDNTGLDDPGLGLTQPQEFIHETTQTTHEIISIESDEERDVVMMDSSKSITTQNLDSTKATRMTTQNLDSTKETPHRSSSSRFHEHNQSLIIHTDSSNISGETLSEQQMIHLLESRYQKVVKISGKYLRDPIWEVLLKETGEKRAVECVSTVPSLALDLTKKIAELSHPHIVPMRPPFVLGNCFCIEMDYMEHGSLKECFDRFEKAPSEKMLRSLILQVSSALQYIHSKNMIHTNINPNSILVKSINFMTDEIHVCLSGFGFAKIMNSSPEFKSSEFSFLSPASDVLSFGATLYKLMTGGGSIVSDPEQLLQTFHSLQRANYDELLHKCVAQMIHPDPTKRLPLEELQKLLETPTRSSNHGADGQQTITPSKTRNYSFLQVAAEEFAKQNRFLSDSTTSSQVARPIRTKITVSHVASPTQNITSTQQKQISNENVVSSQTSISGISGNSKSTTERVGSEDFSGSEELVVSRDTSFLVKSRKYRKSKTSSNISSSSSSADTSMRPPARTKLLTSPPKATSSKNSQKQATVRASPTSKKATTVQDKSVTSSSSQLTSPPQQTVASKATSLTPYRFANLDIGLIDMIMDPKLTSSQFELIEKEFYEIFHLVKVEKLSNLVDEIIAEDMKRRTPKR
ncbi:hypothetical protein C9374_012956 [Naegleria lovaniensis]|uniref:non-specific serine/threonine protein kinase n=1 Tax=Naegleria lovaniensis TaxID=51637 RepID=A0AA88GCJ2_NAELO|nr:uncharacterized protein C9374_012956 [Naegleria lovaniensis]KAG2373013.1 hypothetical protein C9374_012956 [Naegleria lovaniensis]